MDTHWLYMDTHWLYMDNHQWLYEYFYLPFIESYDTVSLESDENSTKGIFFISRKIFIKNKQITS